MHLSRFEISYLSDNLNDCNCPPADAVLSKGQSHRDGVLRGLVFLAFLALPIGLTCGAGCLRGPGFSNASSVQAEAQR